MQSQTAVATDFRYRLEFVYDWMGRRIQKVAKAWDTMTGTYATTGTTLKFLYDGWNVVSELDGSNNQLRVYLWGPDLSGSPTGAGGVGGLLSMFDLATWKYQFYAYDGNGNVGALVDQTGTTTARYDYGPFGELVRSSGSLAKANPFRFSTKYQDDESGLSYYGYRFYDPLAGRWINRDPIEEHGGDSLYSFVGNKPISGADMHGMYQIDFHYYTIYYLFRSKGHGHDTSEYAAFSSQWVDDSPITNPLTLGEGVVKPWRPGPSETYAQALSFYHFPGSDLVKPTSIAHPFAVARANMGLKGLMINGSGAVAGEGLHALADTWSHNGFTAYNNMALNGALSHPDLNIKYWDAGIIGGILRGNVGHMRFDSRPDYPYLRPGMALAAAKFIYAMIPPAKCTAPKAWSDIAKPLRAEFEKKGSELSRSQSMARLIQKEIEGNPVVWYSRHQYDIEYDDGQVNVR